MMHLSLHFTLTEMIHSQVAARRDIANIPGSAEVLNLERLACEILEPVRSKFGIPFSPSSGYRAKALNMAVGGAKNSQHMTGEAVDFTIPGIETYVIADWIRRNKAYDQLILEYYDPAMPDSGWVHCSLKDEDNRGQVLTINSTGVHPGLLARRAA